MKRTGHVARTEENGKRVQNFNRKTWRKEPLAKPSHRWKDITLFKWLLKK